MRDYMQEYARWRSADLDAKLSRELEGLCRSEIEERFYTELEFGTAGIRGILGVGTNRMNVNVVGRASEGLARYLEKLDGAKTRGVAIAYDSRNMSAEFAKETALVLAAHGIKAYLYKTLHSVPQLSFTVLELGAIAGVVITASHNPKEYNGYKVYWEHGGQAGPEQAAAIYNEIKAADYFDFPMADENAALESGLLIMIGEELDEKYYAATKTLLLHPEVLAKSGDMRIVYTPLHGSGCVPVRTILSKIGIKNVSIVPEQEQPDGDFPTVKAPNPESPDAFILAQRLADKVGADVILATDPDSDRLGVAVREMGKFKVLTGNQIGCLLIHYILSSMKDKGTLPKNALVVKSFVSTRMANIICERFNVEIEEVPTGFRFISEKIAQCKAGNGKQFIFGFEESYGFLAGGFSRDKDAICAAMLVSEACVYYNDRGKTLVDVLEDMYRTYGYCKESVKSYTLMGKAGAQTIKGAMMALKNDPLSEIAGVKVEQNNEGLDVIRYTLENDAWLVVRPSGTEPKLKLYIGARESSEAAVDALLDSLMRDADDRLSGLLGLK